MSRNDIDKRFFGVGRALAGDLHHWRAPATNLQDKGEETKKSMPMLTDDDRSCVSLFPFTNTLVDGHYARKHIVKEGIFLVISKCDIEE